MKKITFIVAFISIVHIICAVGSDIMTQDYLRYRLDDGSITIVSAVTKNVTTLSIPSHIGGVPVVSIADDAFAGCTSLTSITIPNGVTRIGCRVFYNCRLLNNLTIPNSVISIGSGIFHNCYSLTNLTMPTFLVNIPANTFRSCRSLSKLTIPIGVTSIGDNAFTGCKSLRTVILPDTVMHISPLAFADTVTRPETAGITIGGTEYRYTDMTQVLTEHITVRGDQESGAFITGRDVTLAPYRIGKFLVTNRLYRQIMCSDTDTSSDITSVDDTRNDMNIYYPALNVTFYEAITFCNKLSLRSGLMPCYTVDGIDDWDSLRWDDIPTERTASWDQAECDYSQDGYRLPTEAELEFAARGGDPADKAKWGCLTSQIGSLITMTDITADISAHAVDSGTPNPLGLYDITGKAAQLCNDRWITAVRRGIAVNPIGYDALSERMCLGSPSSMPNTDTDKILLRSPAPITAQSESAKHNVGLPVGLRLARTVCRPIVCSVTFLPDSAPDLQPKIESNATDTSGDVTNDSDNDTYYRYVKYGKTVSKPDNPYTDGQTFIGWFSDIDGRSLYDFRCPITQDTQIYGRFISRRSPISAPRMQTIIRKHQTADVSADRLGIDSSSDVTLTAYQLSIDAVSGTLFASVMGYAPQTSDDSTAPVGDISVWQAIAFCNKLSIRAGRTPCYNVEGIDDWIGVPFCDIPMNADTAWETLTTDMTADGYRLPTAAELIYAEQHNNSDKDTDKTDDAADYKTTSVTIALPAEQRLLSKDKVIPPWRRQIGAILRLARTIK